MTKNRLPLLNALCKNKKNLISIGFSCRGLLTHSRNYIDVVVRCRQQPWTDYPIPLTWHGSTRAKVHSLAKRIAVAPSGNRTRTSYTVVKWSNHCTTTPKFLLFIQLTLDNSNIHGTSKKVRPIESSSYRDFFSLKRV